MIHGEFVAAMDKPYGVRTHGKLIMVGMALKINLFQEFV